MQVEQYAEKDSGTDDIWNWLKTQNSGSAIIIARAGSGKTRQMVKLSKAVTRGMPHWKQKVLAFNAEAARELNNRGVYHAATFHSYGNTICRNSFHPSVEVCGSKTKKYLKEYELASQCLDSQAKKIARKAAVELVRLAKIHLYVPKDLIDALKKRRDAGETLAYIDQLTALDTDGLTQLGKQFGVWESHRDHPQLPRIVSNVLEMAYHVVDYDLRDAAQRRGEGQEEALKVSYDDMLYLPLALGVNIEIDYDIVFVDEAQDANACYRALVTQMTAKDGKCLAVGDPLQAIYIFNGATTGSIDTLRQQLSSAHQIYQQNRHENKVFSLPVTYRCPVQVVNFLNEHPQIGHGLAINGPQFVMQARPDAPSGQVIMDFQWDLSDPSLMPQANGTEAVISRTNAALLYFRYFCCEQKIPCLMLGRADLDRALLGVLDDLLKGGTDLKRQIASRRMELSKAKASAKISTELDNLACLKFLLDQKHGGNQWNLREALEGTSGLTDQQGEQNREDKLILSTVHKSKGLEYDTVYILKPECGFPIWVILTIPPDECALCNLLSKYGDIGPYPLSPRRQL